MSAPISSRLRVLLDANILISILVSPDPLRSAAAAILNRAEAGACSIVVPFEAIEETKRVASEKPWLTNRIPSDAIDHLLTALGQVAEMAPPLSEPPPPITHDPGDDYLLAQAVLTRVDVLVTRDLDLLSIGEFAGVTIVDPATLLGLLRSTS